VTMRFHNSSGLADAHKRKKYLRRLMRRAQIVGLCETGLDCVGQEDMREHARWDKKVNATVYHASDGHKGRGLALLIARDAPVVVLGVRARGNTASNATALGRQQREEIRLQYMIVDRITKRWRSRCGSAMIRGLARRGAFETHFQRSFQLHGGAAVSDQGQGSSAERLGPQEAPDDGGAELESANGTGQTEAAKLARNRVIAKVKRHMSGREVSGVMEGLEVDSIISRDNIAEAIKQIKKGTVPGQDGFGTDFYAREDITPLLLDHLVKLFSSVVKDKEVMTEAMRMAVITVLYKGRDKDRLECKSYRPISVTAVEYRILMKAVQIKVRPAIEAVVGETNVAYLTDGRRIHANTLLLAELARELERPGRGGVALLVDNTAAFDRVQWEFMHAVLEAMEFPLPFREMMRVVYKDLTYRVKTGGRIGDAQQADNGVRQGCPFSPLAFLLVQEALLICIRDDEELAGIKVSGSVSSSVIGEVRERCMADDTMVYAEGVESVPRLFEIIRDFEMASGQKLNPDKSTGVRFGTEKGKAIPAGVSTISWIDFGEEDLETSLGIQVGPEEHLTRRASKYHPQLTRK